MNTQLIRASAAGQEMLARLLMDMGADMEAKDKVSDKIQCGTHSVGMMEVVLGMSPWSQYGVAGCRDGQEGKGCCGTESGRERTEKVASVGVEDEVEAMADVWGL